jgi:hypothetical protein
MKVNARSHYILFYRRTGGFDRKKLTDSSFQYTFTLKSNSDRHETFESHRADICPDNPEQLPGQFAPPFLQSEGQDL